MKRRALDDPNPSGRVQRSAGGSGGQQPSRTAAEDEAGPSNRDAAPREPAAEQELPSPAEGSDVDDVDSDVDVDVEVAAAAQAHGDEDAAVGNDGVAANASAIRASVWDYLERYCGPSDHVAQQAAAAAAAAAPPLPHGQAQQQQQQPAGTRSADTQAPGQAQAATAPQARVRQQTERHFSLYVLFLEGCRFYVGRSNNFPRRLGEHCAGRGRGSRFTRPNPPISSDPRDHFVVTKPVKHYENAQENMLTVQLISWLRETTDLPDPLRLVRGGDYVQTVLGLRPMFRLSEELAGQVGACFACRATDHKFDTCPQRYTFNDNIRRELGLGDEYLEYNSDEESGELLPEMQAVAAVAGTPPVDIKPIVLNMLEALEDLQLPVVACVLEKVVHTSGQQQQLQAMPAWVRACIKAYLCRCSAGPCTCPDAFELRSHQVSLVNAIIQAEQEGGQPLQFLPSYVLTAGTGTGKSLCVILYLVYAVLVRLRAGKDGRAINTCPLQALLNDQVQALAAMTKRLAAMTRHLAGAGGLPDDQVKTVQVGQSGQRRHLSGTMHIPDGDCTRQVRWSMWHGQGMGSLSDASMAIHVKSEEHERAHIFFATPDKVQWDLLRPRQSGRDWFKDKLLSNLAALVMDEAHLHCDMFGAHTCNFIQCLSQAVWALQHQHGSGALPMMLVSATMGDAKSFAEKLTGLTRYGYGDDAMAFRTFSELSDCTAAVQYEVWFGPGAAAGTPAGARQAVQQKMAPPWMLGDDCQGRLCIYVHKQLSPRDTQRLAHPDVLGSSVRALLFSASKAKSRETREQLYHVYTLPNAQGAPGQQTALRYCFVYDGDTAPLTRRQMEHVFREGSLVDGLTIIGTIALAVGCDIPGLHVAIIAEMLASRDMNKQLMGRVGRKKGELGLVVIGVNDSKPAGRHFLNDPVAFLQQPASRPHVPHTTTSVARFLRCSAEVAILAGCNVDASWSSWLNDARSMAQQASPSGYDTVQRLLDADHPNWLTTAAQACAAVDSVCTTLHLGPMVAAARVSAQLSEDWFVQGFRTGSSGNSSVPVVLGMPGPGGRVIPIKNSTSQRPLVVGKLDSVNLFRDAHCLATYRSATCRYQVADYVMMESKERKELLKKIRMWRLHKQSECIDNLPDVYCYECRVERQQAEATADAHVQGGSPQVLRLYEQCNFRFPHVAEGSQCSVCKAPKANCQYCVEPVVPLDAEADGNANWLLYVKEVLVVKPEHQNRLTPGARQQLRSLAAQHAPTQPLKLRPTRSSINMMLKSPDDAMRWPLPDAHSPLPPGMRYGIWQRCYSWAGYRQKLLGGQWTDLIRPEEMRLDATKFGPLVKSHGWAPFSLSQECRPRQGPIKVDVEGFGWMAGTPPVNSPASTAAEAPDVRKSVSFVLAYRLATMLECGVDMLDVRIERSAVGAVEVQVAEAERARCSGVVGHALLQGGLFVSTSLPDGSPSKAALAWPDDNMEGCSGNVDLRFLSLQLQGEAWVEGLRKLSEEVAQLGVGRPKELLDWLRASWTQQSQLG